MDIEEETIHTKNLGTRYLHTKKIPLLNDDGKPIYLLGVSEDITDKLKAQEALELSERKYKAIVEDQTEFICRLTPGDGVITFANDAYCRACGKEKEELIGSSLFDYIPDYEKTRLKNHFKSFTKAQSVKIIEHRVLGVDNSHQIQQWTDRAIFDEKGNIVEFQSVGRDVTELRLVQQKYELKESLLKEIHHRVKNNLQVISSFIDLQTYYIKNKDVNKILKQSQNRISAIALVYDHLCKSEEISNIYMKQYVKELTNSLSVSLNSQNRRIRINQNIGDILLDINKAIPCGLIINELITNSLKHAFPDEKRGDVDIELNENSKKYILKVSDNGIGMPDTFNIENSDSLGLQIVASLTKQINGQLKIKNGGGAEFNIVF